MRTIKFRRWDRVHEEMLEWEDYKHEMVSDDFEDDDLVLMPGTGLKDKYGKEIYEGDICRVSGNENYSNLYTTTDYDWEYTMNVSGEGYAYKFIDTKDKYFHIYLDEAENMLVEIIGNIFENPELLEEK